MARMARIDTRGILRTLLEAQGSVSSGEVVRATGLSRQAVSRHLRAAVAAGELVPEGAGRSQRYRRPSVAATKHTFATRGLEEDQVWEGLRDALLAGGPVTPEAESSARYAFTELVNNAVDHSGSPTVEILLASTPSRLCFEVLDQGIGVFEKIREALGLEAWTAAIQELSKGKVTTWPERHTGEGVFFSSKAADLFELDSRGLVWIVDNALGDMAISASPAREGTRARFELERQSSRRLEALFAEYTEDLRFAKTRTVVQLFAWGTRFVSRSEAKRLAHGLEKFNEVIVDFAKVAGVGQGFVDELFRVWAAGHPEVKLTPVNMSPPVEFMVRRGLGPG
jgi:anti-sigma regulatory factor (Ser/Thr protein kinase)